MAKQTGIDHLIGPRSQRGLTEPDRVETMRVKIAAAVDSARQEGADQARKALEKESHALSFFKGQVAVHAAAAEHARVKLSQSRGVCWGCHIQPKSSTSAYGRCAACDRQSGV